MIKKIFHRKYVTPLVIATCLAPFITGLFMFFGFFKGSFVKELHEWAGLIMVIIGLAHIISHWPSFKMYLKDKFSWAMGALFILMVPAYFAFVSPLMKTDEQQISPRYFIGLINQADIETFSALTKIDSEDLLARLKANNITVTDQNVTIGALAKQNNQSIFELVEKIVKD